MHYLVVHFDVPQIDPESWRLRVGGAVEHPLELSLSDLHRRPRRTVPVTLECAGNGRARLDPRPVSMPWDTGGFGTAEWTGTPLAPILQEAGIPSQAVDVLFTGADRGIQGGLEQDYARSLAVADAMEDTLLLAYEMDGRPLPPQHGYPLRLLVPGWYGMASVKWLTSIDVLTEPAHAFQNESAYRYSQAADDAGEPVTRMRVRALMVPPGIPDFASRRRLMDAGPTMLRGRAWSGHGPVQRVEVAIDGHWADAHVEPAPAEHAWQEFSFAWVATPGSHTVGCRATDAAGTVQPLEAPWTFQGMGNNAVQEIEVEVRGEG
ncbi:sulfite oxidase [Sinomonas flava]|uniref:sulfite oxidase n=1 Tax=Sinomonas flava TaxID=496857 RepID=UPI0039A59BC6